MQNNYSRDNQTVVFAGFFVRMAAHLIDMLIVGVLLLFARIPLAAASIISSSDFMEHGILFAYSLKDIYLYIAGALYYVLLTYCTGTTLGKRLMNLRVVAADGRKLSFLDIVYRETVGRFLCSFFFGVGYIMAGIDGQKRGLHDMICDTRVVYEKRVKVTVEDNRMPQGCPPVQDQRQPAPMRAVEPEAEQTDGAEKTVHTLPVSLHQEEKES